ncbi:MAG: hypothetical protein ACE15E_15585 [Acidobacteriota bacterium]
MPGHAAALYSPAMPAAFSLSILETAAGVARHGAAAPPAGQRSSRIPAELYPPPAETIAHRSSGPENARSQEREGMLDDQFTRFGLRKFELAGPRILLNRIQARVIRVQAGAGAAPRTMPVPLP